VRPLAAIDAPTIAQPQEVVVAENPRRNDPDECGRAANQQQADDKQ
jgi:hypothetical protein